MKVLLSPRIVAALLILMKRRYAEERGKSFSRIRFSRKTLLRVAARTHLRAAFVEELARELEELGHILIQGEPDFGLHVMDVAGWTKVSAKRVTEEIRAARIGRLSEEDLLELLTNEEVPDDEDIQED